MGWDERETEIRPNTHQLRFVKYFVDMVKPVVNYGIIDDNC